MYVPDHFAVATEEVVALLRHAQLAILTTGGPAGLYATHLPMIYDAATGTLRGHVARGNPHTRLAIEGEALAIFQGPDGYVSPSWYPSKAADPRVVPTWNYEAVHVYGALAWRDEAAWIIDNVTELTARFEAERAEPWQVNDAPADYVQALVRGVIGVEIRISRVEAKRKLSQNRSAADQRGVIEGLEGREGGAALAAAMRRLEF
ncbi:FMN-binding negative transcriptional regulator [Phenylobacterium immobile]|uniref:FMN-binding negative transcriptional regulator n=1 Tax=Phenylobacterium immobile TaxID=21 RepID=UPI000A777446|nr:FMN-binding negative transcriptional regulator [Phenylobacterium immobile]